MSDLENSLHSQKAVRDIEEYSTRPELKLHGYQNRAHDFCLELKQAFLAMDMGTGKTAVSLEIVKSSKQKAFVFGPLRTITTSWPDEIKKWAPELTFKVLHGPDKTLVGTKDIDILLMNYEGLNWLSKQRGNWTRRMVIYDESSMCKSHATQRFKLLRKMRPLWTDFAICLSATPAPNSLQELWAQYFLLDSGRRLGKNISAFRRGYCRSFSYPGMAFTQYEVAPEKKQAIIDAVAPITFRLAANDYLDMPSITYNSIGCVLSAALTKQYKKLEKEFFIELEDAEIEAPQMAQLSMKLRQFVQGGLYDEDKVWHELHQIKLKALKELVETSAGQPILCAIQFRGELAMIQAAFPDAPVIAGGTTAKQGSEYIRQWNSGQMPLLLCHPASLSHGVNLQTGGHILLWYGLTWSLEQYIQLAGRLYRQGQLHGVIIHHLIMTGTVDEAVMKAIGRKDTSQKNLLKALKDYHNS